jgi:hypothetical protein
MIRSEVLLTLISGATAAGYSVCALFFLRFWRTTRDRLFVVFSAAFWLLALQRLALGLLEPLEEWRTGWYLLRLLAFLLILGALVDKNRRGEDGTAQPEGWKQ